MRRWSLVAAVVVSLIGGLAHAAGKPAPVAKNALKVIRHEGSCHGYLAMDPAEKHGIIIDAPSGSAERFVREANARGLKLGAILLTHAHGDHTMDLAEMVRATKLPVLHMPTVFSTSRRDTKGMTLHALDDGAKVNFGGIKLQVMHVPGHTDDSLAFFDRAGQALFVGDTIQAGGIGGHMNDPVFVNSLRRLSLLPPQTRLFAGHGVPTTLGDEVGWIRSMLEDVQ